eukprot:2301799-Pleurochrysis_carterae.AAC.1
MGWGRRGQIALRMQGRRIKLKENEGAREIGYLPLVRGKYPSIVGRGMYPRIVGERQVPKDCGGEPRIVGVEGASRGTGGAIRSIRRSVRYDGRKGRPGGELVDGGDARRSWSKPCVFSLFRPKCPAFP